MKLDHKTVKLDNGIRVISVPLKSTAAVTSLILIGTGNQYETKELSGISHYLEHLFFKGSKKYPTPFDLSKTLDGIGAEYNAFTADEMTGFYVKTASSKAELALDVMSDYLINPIFDAEEVEREKSVILEELRMYRDNPQRFVYEIFEKALFGDQPAGFNLEDQENALPGIQRKDLLEYFEKQYRGDNIVAVIAGNITHEKAKELADKFFKSLPSGNSYEKEKVKVPKQGLDNINIYNKESDQTHFVLGFNGISINDDRKYPLGMFSVILGGGMSSRLFSEIRVKRGLAYYVGASRSSGTDHGHFTIRAGVTNTKLEEAIEATVDELVKIKKEGVLEEELVKAKNYLEGSMLLGLEGSDDVAEYFGTQATILKEIIEPEEVLRRVKNVSLEQVREVAEDIIKRDALCLALVGPHKGKEEKLKSILDKL